MKTKTRIINMIIVLLILFSCNSNLHQNLFSTKQVEEVLDYFEAKEVFLEVENNLYTLNIVGSKIENLYILEEYSKMVALKLYQILNEKPEIAFNTGIKINITGKKNKSYSYEFAYLAEIQYGLESIKKSINHLKINKVFVYP